MEAFNAALKMVGTLRTVVLLCTEFHALDM
jgi:hypothetical protein